MNMKIKLKDIISTVNDLVKDMTDKRIDNFGNDLHNAVRERVTGFLDTVGLEYTTWRINAKWGDNFPTDDLFTLDLPNFVEDKRSKYGRQGRVKDIVFILSNKVNEELSLASYLKWIEERNLSNEIMNNMEYVIKLKKDLADAETNLSDLKERYLNLPKL